MSRFLPRRLGTQIALLVALALLVAQTINFVLLLQSNQRQSFIQTSTLATARLAEAIGRANAAPGQRAFESTVTPITPQMVPRPDAAARARDLLNEIGVTVGHIAAAEVPAREVTVRMDNATRTLRRAAAQRRVVLVLSAEIGPGRWVSSAAPFPDDGGRVIGWLLFQTMVLYGVVLIPLLWIGQRLARPLVELRAAADEAFTDTAPTIPIVERGPDDIRRLIAAFNGMRTRIAAMLDEKDRMLGAIGHDLRTPLASLRVRTEFVEDDAERDRMAQTIDDMNRTLDDILSLARLGRPSEAETRVDLPALVDSVIEDFRDLGAAVTLADAPRIAVTMRQNLMKRAIRNLIENAVKYGSGAQVSVAREGAGVAVVIDDDGPGIPDHAIDHMFEAFTRLDNSRSRDTGGAGLGLALARAIVQAQNGRLTLANRAEGGLRATLWLPA